MKTPNHASTQILRILFLSAMTMWLPACSSGLSTETPDLSSSEINFNEAGREESALSSTNTVKPIIIAASRGCNDMLCIQVRLRNPTQNTYIDLYSVGGEYLSSVVGPRIDRRLSPNTGGQYIFTIRVPDVLHERLLSEGLGVVVVNDAAIGSWSNFVTVPSNE